MLRWTAPNICWVTAEMKSRTTILQSVFLRRQFSLRSLLVLILIAATLFAWWRSIENSYEKQYEAASEIVNRGGYCASRQSWIGILVGQKRFKDVWHISFEYYEPQLTNKDLDVLSLFPHLTRLSLHTTRVTDEGLVQVAKCTQLEALSLEGLQITDAGLLHLRQLQNLDWLNLYNTQVTNQSLLEFEKAFPNCEVLK